ncbi:MAG: hypothetical protein V3T17_12425 [Pseudomonadales bacterium]
MKLRVQSRWLAFLIHLALSFVIFIGLAALIFFWWFPGALFSAAGGWDGIKIVAAVDLVLGPLLTLIVYNAAKPLSELVRDLSIIVAVQFSCLVTGVYVVFDARPILVVHAYDTFYAFKRTEVVAGGIDLEKLDEFVGGYPKVLYVEVPQDPVGFAHMQMMVTLEGKTPIPLRSDLYRMMPSDAAAVEALLHGEVDHQQGSCIRLSIESSYNAGLVCVDPGNLSFSYFEKKPNE